ncbi:MAG: PAS domain-containing hybrid sensor histidine kinase/response regulator [Oceanospirillaceae bacterium]
MFQNWQLIGISLSYICLLFLIAYLGDKYRHKIPQRSQPIIYALTLGVYCTSWSFLGTTAQAATSIFSHLPIFIGPILLFIFAWGFIQRIIKTSLKLKVTSIADLLAARFGKSQKLAVIITFVALIGTMPYIALQLKAIVYSYQQLTAIQELNSWQTGLVVTAILAGFTLFFGIREVDVTERHPGVMLAIAFESLVKVSAFLILGLFVTFFIYSSPAELWQASKADNLLSQQLQFPNIATMLSSLVIGMAAFLALPRQFQVMVVELRNSADSQLSRFVFPVYLLIFAVFAIPLGLAGQLLLGDTVPADSYVLFLPAVQNQLWLTMLAFLGAISAASSMVIIAAIALSTMLSNEIFFPLLFNHTSGKNRDFARFKANLLNVRKVLACLVLLLGYGVFLAAPPDKLSSLGEIAFGALAQLTPALIAAFYWRSSSLTGVICGLSAGFSLWFFLNLLPQFGLYTQPVSNGVIPTHMIVSLLSLSINVIVMWWVSQFSRQSVQERMQASHFLDWQSPDSLQPPINKNIDASELQLLASRFIGEEKAKLGFNQFLASNDAKYLGSRSYNNKLITHTERMLTSVMGSSSSRLVISSALQGKEIALDQIVLLIEDASSQGTQFSHSLLQSAIENSTEGISIVDKQLKLMAWNQRYIELFDYPKELVYIGCPIESLIRYNVEQGRCGPGDVEDKIRKRLSYLQRGNPHSSERRYNTGQVIRIQGNPLPGGGFVMIFSDISAFKQAEQVLREANQDLETRVNARTKSLEQTNKALELAREKAVLAHVKKSQYLNACSHDLMQPLEAARLFTTALSAQKGLNKEHLSHIANIENSLKVASHLLSDLGDIARIESGNIKIRKEPFAIEDIFNSLAQEFNTHDEKIDIQFHIVKCSAWVYSDPSLLRRVLHNLIANAFRYASPGKVLLGCRHVSNTLSIQVIDNGPGIAADKQTLVFEQFTQLDKQNVHASKGLGLGLNIAKSFSQLLEHRLALHSEVSKGCNFSIAVPISIKQLQKSVKPSNNVISLQGVTVLCVENDPNLLAAMVALLETWQCKVLACDNAAKAYQYFSDYNDEIDIMLMDYQLSDDESGLTLMTELNATSSYGIPGVLITATTDVDLPARAVLAGFEFMRKPMKPATLRALMSSILMQKMQRDYSLLDENEEFPTSS